MNKQPSQLKFEDFFAIAKIIDNEYIGKIQSFQFERNGLKGYWYLKTNKCDMCSQIRVHGTMEAISKIEVLGEYTDGWQLIHLETLLRVNVYLMENGFKLIEI